MRSGAQRARQNPLTSKPGTDIPELIRYARSKNVGILLYLNDVAGWEYGLERIIRSFSEWGAAGLKYGFMRKVDGQAKVNRTREIVRLCAKYKLLVNFHDGPIPPSGDVRTWPNLITREYGPCVRLCKVLEQERLSMGRLIYQRRLYGAIRTNT